MSILRGPGILLNPITARQPVYLPQFFDLALAAPGANLCGVEDELGAIAHALHEGGKPVAGNRLFGILRSEYTLVEQRGDVLECIAHAKQPILRQAMWRSSRYFVNDEEPRPKSGIPRRFGDFDIVTALCKHGTRAAAAEALGYSPATISHRISQAAEDSVLGIFKGVFMRRRTAFNQASQATKDSAPQAFKNTSKRGGSKKKRSDEEIDAALTEHGSQTAAAAALDIAQGTISTRIANATEDSPLYARRGTFKSRATEDVSENDVAAALKEHGSIAAAARALGVSSTTISSWIRYSAKDSPLYALKGGFEPGREKRKAVTEVDDAKLRRERFLRSLPYLGR